MTFLDIRKETEELLTDLAQHLPTVTEYIFLDMTKYRALVMKLNKLSARQQQKLAASIGAAKVLTEASWQSGMQPNYSKIFHSVVNHREEDAEKRKVLTSLLASIFSIKGIIEKERRNSQVKFFRKNKEVETRPCTATLDS